MVYSIQFQFKSSDSPILLYDPQLKPPVRSILLYGPRWYGPSLLWSDSSRNLRVRDNKGKKIREDSQYSHLNQENSPATDFETSKTKE